MELLAARDLGVNCFIFIVVLVIVGIQSFFEGRGALDRRWRRRSYGDATGPFPEARVTVTRNVERDLIELPGPPCRARVRFYHHTVDERRIDYTEFVADADWTGGAMRVTTPEWRGGLERYYGGRDLTIGDDPFDRRFVIQANPAELARHFLDDVTRGRILRLDATGTGPLLFQARPRQLLVRVSNRMREGQQLQRFIDDCYGLVDRLRGEVAGVELQPVAIGDEGTCRVCGTAIEKEKRVLCGQCRTPHHSDCWAYNDGCSTFACGGRTRVRA